MCKNNYIAICTLLFISPVAAGYEEIRQLEVDADGLNRMEIDAGAGSLNVIGVQSGDRISVTAAVRVPGRHRN
jgi:hypothetical protein